MRHFLSIWFLLCCWCMSASGQAFPVYSDYLLNGLVINPAYAGSRDVLSTVLSYRNQWVGFEGAPVTETFSAHMPLINKSVALGILVINQQVAVTNQTGFYGNYAYRVHVSNEGMLSFGLKFGIDSYTQNLSSVSTINPNPAFSQGNISFLEPNAGFGVYYYTNDYFAGVAVPTLLSYQTSNTQAKAYNNLRNDELLINAGFVVPLADNFRIKPSTLIQYQLNSTHTVDLNCNFIFFSDGQLWIGGSYRWNSRCNRHY